MTTLVRRDPRSDIRSTMDRLFESSMWPRHLLPSEESHEFPVEICETADAIEVKASLPGVKPGDVDISVQNGVLTVKAELKEEAGEQRKDYYNRELRYGFLHRSFTLPATFDTDRAKATFEDGMLYLTLPKEEVAKPRQIKVN